MESESALRSCYHLAKHEIQLDYTDKVYIQPSGRLSAILTSSGPLQIVIPAHDPRHLSAATRLAHSLDVYHKIDASILEAKEVQDLSRLSAANVVLITDGNDGLLAELLAGGGTPFTFEDGTLVVRGRVVKQSEAAVFLHTHPTRPEGLMLVIYADNETALERALRLFPVRTGITVPDWVIVSPEADKTGAGGVVGAG